MPDDFPTPSEPQIPPTSMPSQGTAPAVFGWSDCVACRVCGAEQFRPVMSFGMTPISDMISDDPDTKTPANRAPLDLVQCQACGLAQISITVDPAFIYNADYPYFSSVSPALSAHFQHSAEALIRDQAIDATSTIVEAASNDGYLLRHFKQVGAQVLGFDPSTGPGDVARANGIDTYDAFFTEASATELAETGLRADIFLANNVLAHVPDTQGFMRGVAKILKPDGIAVIEVPYLVDLVDHGEFDTIYHQHLCYFLVGDLARLATRTGLRLQRAERIAIHGGSLRLTFGLAAAEMGSETGVGTGTDTGWTANFDTASDTGPDLNTGQDSDRGPDRGPDRRARIAQGSIADLIAMEHRIGAAAPSYVDGLRRRSETLRKDLRSTLQMLAKDGAVIRAYGAAGKANTMLAWCGLDAPDIGYVADLNPRKHGKYMPGTDLEIVSPDRLVQDQPDYVVILAWNFSTEILAQLRPQLPATKFILPLPEFQIV